MFDGIIGNDNIKQELIKSIKLNKLSHSYLFIGTEGIGKKLIAKEFAKMILCINKNQYCDSCKSCIEFNSSNHPDFMILNEEGETIKVEQIRILIGSLIGATYSIVYYFMLLTLLGVNNYGNRSIAKVRDNKKLIKE